MRVIGYLLFFLANPIRRHNNIINHPNFIESHTKLNNDTVFSTINNHISIIKIYSTQKDDILQSNEEIEPIIGEDSSISDFNNNNIESNNINLDSNIDTDTYIEDSNFNSNLDDSSVDKSSSKNLVSNIPKVDNTLSNQNLKSEKRKIFEGSTGYQNKEKYIIQNKLPRLYGERMHYRQPIRQEFTVARKPRKLLKSTRSTTLLQSDLENSSNPDLKESDPVLDSINKNISSENPDFSDIDSDVEIVTEYPDINQSGDKGEFISKSTGWDIPTSQIRVKGAYFIQRYVQELREPFKKNDKDTGSSEFQIASLTARIDYLIEHVKKSPKDISAKLKLLKLAHRRRKHLIHLFKTDKDSFQKIIDTFNLYLDTRPYTYQKVLPDYIYRRRNSTKRTYTKEGRSSPFISSYARFDNITLDSLIHK